MTQLSPTALRAASTNLMSSFNVGKEQRYLIPCHPSAFILAAWSARSSTVESLNWLEYGGILSRPPPHSLYNGWLVNLPQRSHSAISALAGPRRPVVGS